MKRMMSSPRCTDSPEQRRFGWRRYEFVIGLSSGHRSAVITFLSLWALPAGSVSFHPITSVNLLVIDCDIMNPPAAQTHIWSNRFTSH